MAIKKSGRIFKVLLLAIAVTLAGSSLSAGGTKDQGKTSSKSTVASSDSQRAEEWDCVVIFGKDGIYAPPKWTGGGNSQTVCAIREFD